MDYTYKNCDNKCLELIDRKYYLCSMYEYCKKNKLTDEQKILVLAFRNKKKAHSFIDLLDIVRAKSNRQLTESETKLISRLFDNKL